MIICVAGVLDAAALAAMRVELAAAKFEDGRTTAGFSARQVKNNLQLSTESEPYKRVAGKVLDALAASEVVQAATMPRAIRPLLISRYETGMEYGRHVDNAVMGWPPIRTDLSFTVFVSSPAEYEGGELILELSEGDQSYKLDAGSVVIYPSTLLHRVSPIKSGVRTVAVGWIQSLCSDPRVREVLFDLYRVRKAVYEKEGKSETVDLLSKTHSNLLRAFALP